MSSLTDARGGEHLRFEHTLPGTGLPVFHAGATAHFTADGSISWLQTDFRADFAGLDASATITMEAASAIAIAHVEASCATGQSTPIVERTDLGVLSNPETRGARLPRPPLGAHREVHRTVGLRRRQERARALRRGAVAGEDRGRGDGYYRAKDANDKKSIDITFTGTAAAPSYAMITEAAPNERVFTHAFGSKSALETNDPAVWDVASPVRGAAVDAHFFTRQALPFLRAFHKAAARGRLATPPLGNDVHVFVHDNASNNGANARARYDLVTGWDILKHRAIEEILVANELPYSAAYDAVAHELGHLVIEHTSGLLNAIDPGALNESFADVMGAAAEHALAPDDAKNFTIGEDLYFAGETRARERFEKASTAPQAYVQSRRRQNPLWPRKMKLGEDDNCSVHRNSGIPNRAFSLVVAGGSLLQARAGSCARAAAHRCALRPRIDAGDGADLLGNDRARPNGQLGIAALAQIAEALVVGGLPAATTVSCAWYAVGVFTPRTPIERSALDLYCKPPAPSPAPAAPPKPSGVTGTNLCAGHGDAIV